MSTLAERIIGAAQLNPKTYEEVEADPAATTQALLVVVLAAVSSGIAAARLGPTAILATLVGALVGWVVWALITYLLGTKVMPEPQTSADLGQLLRVLGFAMSPGLLGILGIIPFLGGLIAFALWIWQLAAMVVGVRQALDYSTTGRAVLVCVIGFCAYLAVMLVFGLMFGGMMAVRGGL